MLGIGPEPRSPVPVGRPEVTGPPAPGGYGDGVKRRSQIQMSEPETKALLEEARTMTMCTFHHDGTIHAVAMWYGFLGNDLATQTKVKSQKAVNLRRDSRITCLVESGEGYDELRGVEIVGWAELIEEPTQLWDIGVSVFERHVAPYDESRHHSQVEAMLHNRVGVRVHANRTVTWDHRKLGMAPGAP
jgi:PPOX class probable F420-dependent enzyme